MKRVKVKWPHLPLQQLDLRLGYCMFDLELMTDTHGESITKAHTHTHIQTTHKRITIRLFQSQIYLLEFVGQLLRVQLHRRQHFLVLGQVENLNGVWKHWTHLLLFVCCIFTCLQVNTERWERLKIVIYDN